MKKLLLSLLILSAALYAQPPFLSQGYVPHYTKKIANNWDNDFLELTDKQKVQLVKIKDETMQAIGAIKEKLIPLEEELAHKILANNKPDTLKVLVKRIAEYKSQATMVHLKCVYNTQQVLTKDQLDLLPSL